MPFDDDGTRSLEDLREWRTQEDSNL
jgi:hypothetical protein